MIAVEVVTDFSIERQKETVSKVFIPHDAVVDIVTSTLNKMTYKERREALKEWGADTFFTSEE